MQHPLTNKGCTPGSQVHSTRSTQDKAIQRIEAGAAIPGGGEGRPPLKFEKVHKECIANTD